MVAHLCSCFKSVVGPRHEKACLQGFRKGHAPTSKIEISLVACLDIILSDKGMTKVLIRLCGCAGWSAPLFVPKP